MHTLLPDRYVPQPITVNDLQIASLAWGFTIGFGFLTVWKAVQQTASVLRRYGFWKLNTPYIWMIWLEILVCLIFSIICWLHLNEIIPPSFAFYFVILTTWALQVQFLLQIIINRVSILLTDRRKALRLKISVAILITAINISVYCIWVPARLQVSDRYEYINNIWDRCEKVIYLLVDAALNWYFIRTVKKELVSRGLVKYDRLVRFNMWIITFSLSMDILIIGMMSLKNSFVYMQFHPLAYIVKLNIEMSMADLIATVSKSSTTISHASNISSASHYHQREPQPSPPPTLYSNATSASKPKHKPTSPISSDDELELNYIPTTDTETITHKRTKSSSASTNSNSSIRKGRSFEVIVDREVITSVESMDGLEDLNPGQKRRKREPSVVTIGGGRGVVDGRGSLSLEERDRKVEMGVSTKVFV